MPKRPQPLTDKQRAYRKLGPRVDVPSTETRQSVNKELRQQSKSARRRRKQMLAAQQTPRKSLPRAKWLHPLLTAPFNKRSRKARVTH